MEFIIRWKDFICKVSSNSEVVSMGPWVKNIWNDPVPLHFKNDTFAPLAPQMKSRMDPCPLNDVLARNHGNFIAIFLRTVAKISGV